MRRRCRWRRKRGRSRSRAKDKQEPAEEEEEAPPLNVGEEEAPMMEEDTGVWPEQHATLNFIFSELTGKARRRHRQHMVAAQAAQVPVHAAPAIADNNEI